MTLSDRARIHAALGDERRLLIFDELTLSDRTVAELARISGMEGNLLAHHLDILEGAGLIERRVSEGDRRRRYVSLTAGGKPVENGPGIRPFEEIAFVCTRNSARSQFAAAYWTRETGRRATSAGSQPSAKVHPKAVRVALERGIDLSGATPGGYERIPAEPDLLISVCDRARESGLPNAKIDLHWSVPDPVADGSDRAFRSAFDEIAERVGKLTTATLAGTE